MAPEQSKPKWLEVLETESWQAELLISGVALFGAIQLPGLIEHLINFTLTNVQVADSPLFYILFILLYFGAYLIIGGFLLHFILRAFWVGLIGFNSVFSGVIDTENDSYYSKFFLKKVVQDLPLDSNVIIRNLDHFCSVIFAVVGVFAMMMMAFVVDVSVLYILKLLLSTFLPAVFFKYLYILIGVVFYAFLFALIIFNTKRFKKSDKAQLWYYRIFSTFNKAFLHVFYKPVQYISFSIITNMDYKKYIKYVFLISFVSSISAGLMVGNSNLMYFAKNSFGDSLYMENFDRPDKMIPEHYENLRMTEESPILSAILESDKISGEQFQLFVPIFNNEKSLCRSCTKDWEAPDAITKVEKKKLERIQYGKCYEKYHRFFLNEKEVFSTSAIKMNHPNQREFGMLFYFSTTGLSTGQNMLKIEKIDLETKEVFRRISIPFQVIQE